jgi:hypothetical protein
MPSQKQKYNLMTKKKREYIYWATMFEIVAFGLNDSGICWAFYNASKDSNLRMKDLPELEDQRPKIISDYPYWFKRNCHVRRRLECLSKAIDLCHHKTTTL